LALVPIWLLSQAIGLSSPRVNNAFIFFLSPQKRKANHSGWPLTYSHEI